MNHIATIKDAGFSWCGEKLGNEFYFKDAEHAAINGLHDAKIVCETCLKIIIESLEKGRPTHELE